jgi:GT2 family glycosyltransferase
LPDLAIVIPTLGRPSLSQALDALGRQHGADGRFEVIVVSDAEAGDVQQAVAGRPYPARQLSATRPGASAARNTGWRATDAPIVLFLGDDMLASPRLVAAHLDEHDRHTSELTGVVGQIQWPRRPRPTAFMRWIEHGLQFDFEGVSEGETGWWRLYTANASVKRAMLQLVDGFDEEAFPYLYEDIDLAARMAEHGFGLRYAPAAQAAHDHPQTLEDWRERVRIIGAAERRFCARHPTARPYFHDLFAEAARHPPARGRGARLAAFVPRATPWLGPRVWASFDMWNRQQLVGPFMAGWEDAAHHAECL